MVLALVHHHLADAFPSAQAMGIHALPLRFVDGGQHVSGSLKPVAAGQCHGMGEGMLRLLPQDRLGGFVGFLGLLPDAVAEAF